MTAAWMTAAPTSIPTSSSRTSFAQAAARGIGVDRSVVIASTSSELDPAAPHRDHPGDQHGVGQQQLLTDQPHATDVQGEDVVLLAGDAVARAGRHPRHAGADVGQLQAVVVHRAGHERGDPDQGAGREEQQPGGEHLPGQRSVGPNQRFASMSAPSTATPYTGSSVIDIITQVANGVS